MNGFRSGASGTGFSGPDLVGREALKTRFPVRLIRLNGPRVERTPRGGRSRSPDYSKTNFPKSKFAGQPL